jgi:hypothetical protein
MPIRVPRRINTTCGLAVLIFVVVSLGLLWVHGDRLVFSLDEGIVLDAAARMVHGETLYRDFFGYMSPGSYWLQETAFRLFGLNMRAGRVVVICDFALQCAVLFWLTARLGGKKAALSVTGLFFALEAIRPTLLLAQHRMDSAALSLLSIALCLKGQRRRRAGYWLAAGILIAGAAVCTPSTALIAPVTLIWLVAERPLRRFLIPYSGGVFVVLTATAAALAANGSLVPFWRQMTWLQRNYSSVNIVPYGWVTGGYSTMIGGAAGIDLAVLSLTVFCFALPVVLPLLALAAWSLWMPLHRGDRPWAVNHAIPYLLACTAMYIASTYPRPDVSHLAFVAALPAALTAVWIARYSPPWLGASVVAVLALGAGIFLAQAAGDLRRQVDVATPVGTLRASPADAEAVGALLKAVRPGDGLYAHPYIPVLYFLTQARNPTRYSYLAPGMMTHSEETAALDALENSPPRWLLYLSLSRTEFLRVFPHATDRDHRFPLIDAWSQRDYVPADPPVVVGGYRLYERGKSGS